MSADCGQSGGARNQPLPRPTGETELMLDFHIFKHSKEQREFVMTQICCPQQQTQVPHDNRPEVAAAQTQTGSDYMAVIEEYALEASKLFRFGLDLILTFVFGSVSSIEQTSRQSRSASLDTTNTPTSACCLQLLGGGGLCDGGHNLSRTKVHFL